MVILVFPQFRGRVSGGFSRMGLKPHLWNSDVDQVKQSIKKLAAGHQYEAGDSVLVSRLRHKVLPQQPTEALYNALPD